MKKILFFVALMSVITYASCEQGKLYKIVEFVKNDFSVEEIVQEPTKIEEVSSFNLTGIPNFQTNIWGITGYALKDTLTDSYVWIVSDQKILPKHSQPITIKAKFDRQYLIDGWVDLMVLKEI